MVSLPVMVDDPRRGLGLVVQPTRRNHNAVARCISLSHLSENRFRAFFSVLAQLPERLLIMLFVFRLLTKQTWLRVRCDLRIIKPAVINIATMLWGAGIA